MDVPAYDDSRIERQLSKLMGQEVDLCPPKSRIEEQIAWLIEHGSGGGGSWGAITDKPFETIGDGLSVDDGGVLKAAKPYTSLNRLASYLYDVSFTNIPEDINVDLVPGGCTSFIQNGRLYRNLDFDYSEMASFRVRCSGFEGMGFLLGLTDTELNDILIGQLPYNLADGKNDSGIMAAAHILYNDWDWHGTANGIPLTRLVYHILTKVKSMETIETDLADILPNLVTTSALDTADYLMQFIVSDGTTTVAILPPTTSDGVYEIVDISANPKLTNFRWVADETVDRADLQYRPTGVERWNMIPVSLEELRFTAAYESPDRLSEFIGINETDKDSTDEELEAIYDQARALYEERTRDGTTWQTMHSVIYSSSGIKELYVQEDWGKNHSGCNCSDDIDILEALKKTGMLDPVVDTGITFFVGNESMIYTL